MDAALGSVSPQEEFDGFDFLGDVDPVLWNALDDELSGGEPGSSSDNNFAFEAAPPPLRCVDATHPATCTRCTPCPPADVAHKYELLGEEGKVRGG